MNAMTMHFAPETAPESLPASPLAAGPAPQFKPRRRAGPLVAIVVAHLAVAYLANTGMLSRAVRAVVPEAMTVSIVSPPPPPPSAPAPKFVEVTASLPHITPPPLPLPAMVPVEPTISTPPAQAPATVAKVSEAPPAPPAPIAPPAPAVPHLVSGVEYLRAPAPVYPSISRRMHEAGVVMLRVLVNEQGLPAEVLVHQSSGSSNLDEAGRQAVLRTLFKPYIENGKAVSVFVLVPLNFQLT
jgi:protein TonB